MWKNCPLTENNDVILSMHPIISCYLLREFVFLFIFIHFFFYIMSIEFILNYALLLYFILTLLLFNKNIM